MVFIGDVIESIANYFGYYDNDLLSRDKNGKLPLARNYAYYLLHYEYGYSISNIAKTFCRTTRNIFHQIATVKYLIDNIKEYKQEYNSLVFSVKNKPITN